MRRVIGALFGLLLTTQAHATITCTLPFTLQNNTTADATQVMANYNALVACFTQAASAGANSDITSLSGLTTPLTPTEGGTPVYYGATSGGSANAQTIATLVPVNFSLAAGKRLTFVAGFTNTGATTLNANSTGATNVFRVTPSGTQALTGGEIIAGNVTEVIYDGTQFQLLAPQSQFGGFGPLTNIASATTTDLGTVGSHNANITSTTTITGFGSSASTTYPVYQLTFAGSLTLTYNASSLILPGAANLVTSAGDTAVAFYLGSGNWQIVSYTKASGLAPAGGVALCGATGFTLVNNSGTPNTSLDIAADAAVMLNGSVPFFANAVSATVDTTVNGAVNRLDTGSKANSTWYYFYLISNGSTTGGLASASATSPTMPSGYVYKCLLGTMRTDSSGNFYRSKQFGDEVQFTVVGSSNTPNIPVFALSSAQTNTSVSVAQYVAPIATKLIGVLNFTCGASNTCVANVAPNAAYGAVAASVTTPPPVAFAIGNAGGQSVSGNLAFSMLLETAQTFYYSSTTIATASVGVMGYKLKVNAN